MSTWVDLKNIILSDKVKIENDTFGMTPFMYIRIT
jgi:hypothetical protein